MLTIFVISDATGGTAERVVRAASAQFEDAQVVFEQRGYVRTPGQVREVVQEAARAGGIIVHTLVSDELRRFILAESRQHDVDSLDMMGPILDRLTTHLNLTPTEKPGLYKQLLEAKSRAIEAVDFAFRHDDGQNIDGIRRAEVVLVGISRTMKTPTMLYLAYRGWFAANVPLVPELDVPPPLLEAPAGRVFCLVMNPGRLLELRRARAEGESIPAELYASPELIRKELLHAQQLCLRHGWRRIETTGKSVEEVGREIIALLPERDVSGSAS
jgi:regulator of PEP synthase PpsR (kinase-PPPase family)